MHLPVCFHSPTLVINVVGISLARQIKIWKMYMDTACFSPCRGLEGCGLGGPAKSAVALMVR